MARQRDFVRFYMEQPLSAACTGVVLWVLCGVLLYRYANDWTYAQSFYYTVQVRQPIILYTLYTPLYTPL